MVKIKENSKAEVLEKGGVVEGAGSACMFKLISNSS